MDGSQHQEEAGQWAERWEGRAPGRTTIGSSDPYKGPLPGLAAALGSVASIGARAPRLRSSPGRQDSAEERGASPDSRLRREARGVGARAEPCQRRGGVEGASRHPHGTRREEPSQGYEPERELRGPRATAEDTAGATSTTAVSGFLPPKRADPQDHPRRGWRKAGKGRERGGAYGATSQGPLRASRPLWATGAARGPPKEAGSAATGAGPRGL